MKDITPRLAGILSMVAIVSGCAYVEKPRQPFEGGVSEEALRNANQNPLTIRRIFQTERMMLDSVPVGTIVPYFPVNGLELPENWMYCNGDVVMDPKSPLNGTALPDLTGDRFVMGSINSFGKMGGGNAIPQDGEHAHGLEMSQEGSHDHGGKTGIEENNGVVKELEQRNEIRVRITEQGHRHYIQSDGAHRHTVRMSNEGSHDHGGDNRPSWFGIVYIMKVK